MRAVVVYRTDGLGSRLMAFGNGLRMARALGVPCYLTWNDPQQVGGIADLGQLLDIRRLTPGVKVLRLADALLDLMPTRMTYAGIGDVVDRETLAGSDVLFCIYSRLQRLGDEAAAPRLNGEFAAAARGIVPVPALADRVRDFAARHDLSAAVGVHVRRGDLVGHGDERERVRLIGLDRYFAVLDAAAADAPFFLCTDEPSVVDAFDTRYPARVLRYPTTSWVRDDRAATEDALIEMFLLSGTRFIVAGPSAFSRFAAARRVIPLVVLRNGQSVQQSIDIANAAVDIARQRQHRLALSGGESGRP